MRKAMITTIVDGYDFGQINCWSHNDGRDDTKYQGHFINGEMVDIIEEKEHYVEITGVGRKFDKRTSSTNGCQVRGWVRKEFLIYQ